MSDLPNDFPNSARVVIIGGGAVGASCLYHLAKAGWTDCVLLEKNELTAGSTWHAAGNVPTFSSSWSIMNMQRYSTELYQRLSDEVDYPMNYHVTGSIRLAHSKERMQEFARAVGMGKYQGMELELLAQSEITARYPFLETHDLEGALYDPADGDIDPAQLTQALAKGARDLGARILRFTPMIGLDRQNGEWIVKTEKGDIRAEYVVNAAGYYAKRVAEFFRPFGGRELPMMVMSHQYLLSEEVPEIAAWSKEVGHKLPLLRDVDSSYYLRQEKTGFNLGPYERNCKAHWVRPDDPMPEDFSFQLYPDDLERLEWYIEDAMARVPLLGSVGVQKVINGPIPYAPDGNPLIGPMPGVPNAFEACVFTFGIAQGGGAGKVLSEWIIEGATEWDMWSCDPRRFTGYADADYCVQKGMEVYGHEYAMHFPYHRWPAGKDKRLSPLHDRLEAAGAQFGAYNGWERANWFAHSGDDISEESTQTWSRLGPWQKRIQEECEAVRDGCGVLAISGFSRFLVQGKGAAEWLEGLSVSKLPAIGRVGLMYFSDEKGRIITEMSAMRFSDEEIGLITAGVAQWHDLDWLKSHAPTGIDISDNSEAMECLLVTGPKARDILAPLVEEHDLSRSWLSLSMKGKIAGQEAALARVSFAGELGWEIHTAPENAPKIWDALTKAGVKPFGMYALNSLRIEKAYKSWKGDLSTDYTVLEMGLDRFIALDKPEFLGKSAILQERAKGSAKKFTVLTIECEEFDAPYMANIWLDGKIIGECTSGAYGYRVQKNIALAMVLAKAVEAGASVEVEIYGKKYPAKICGDAPLWDPKNERLRA